MKKKIIVINGPGGCGKDTFVKFCRKLLKRKKLRVYNTSSIDAVKKLARRMGWDGTKNAQGRKFLSDIKKLWIDFNDGPTNVIVRLVGGIRSGAIFVHIREAEEIEKLVKMFPGSLTLHISREVPKVGNRSDDKTEEYKYSHLISNSGTLKELEEKAAEFLKKIGLL